MRILYVAFVFAFAGIVPATAQQQAEMLDQDRGKITQAEKDYGPASRELADALLEFTFQAETANVSTPEVMQRAQRAVEVTEKAYGYASAKHVMALVHQAGLEEYNGDFTAEQRISSEALSIAHHLSPPNPEVVSEAASAEASACAQVGDFAGALVAYREAAESVRSTAKPDPVRLAEILNDRALVYSALHRDDEALADMREAYLLAEKYFGHDRPEVGVAANNLGTSLLRNGRPEEAIPYLEQALAAAIQFFGPDNIHVAITNGNLGDALARAGKFDRAWTVLQQAVDQCRRILSPQHPGTSKILTAQARALAAGGDLTKAVASALEAESISRQHFQVTSQALPEREALDYAKARAHGLDVALSVLSADPAMTGNSIFENVIRSRALVADGLASRNHEVARSEDPEVRQLAQTLAERRTKLAQLAVTQSPSDAAFATTMAHARAEFEEAETTLAEHSAAFRREQQERSITWQQVDGALPDGGALISYVRYRQYAVRRVDPKAETIESYAAFVLNKGESVRFVPLGPAHPIDDLVASLRALVEKEATSPGMSPASSEQRYRQVGEKLRRAIWDPLAGKESSKATTIFLVPDGMLHFVNVTALPAGNDRYLIEKGAPIHRLTSERDLLAADDGQVTTGLLAVGGPDFGPSRSSQPVNRGAMKVSCEDIGKMHFSSLPATLPELREVSSLFHEAEPSASVVALTGNAASKSGFLSRAESQSVLHLATHAFFIPAACAQNQTETQKDASLPSYENPLLRSGLVFSGPTKDNILTAQEISSLSLTGTQWAVLSACDSGMGDLQDGEGVLGLQRAFRVAGARTIIMSLWPVDDESTRRFMRNLYRERFRQHLTTSDALHQATLQTLREIRAEKHSTHPFYWAGFVATGDWH